MKKLSFIFYLFYLSLCVVTAIFWFKHNIPQLGWVWVLVAYWVLSYALKNFRWYKV